MFSLPTALSFYTTYLGFHTTFTHASPGSPSGSPLYMGIKRGDLEIHLTEHHGDACPGSTIFVPVDNVKALHEELSGKEYAYMRPGLEEMPWGVVLEVVDPFGNRIRFCQRAQSA